MAEQRKPLMLALPHKGSRSIAEKHSMGIEIRMPSTQAGMDQATLVRWLKSEGDKIVKGEAIAEIETEKVTLEIEAECDGTLGRILVLPGSQDVSVGTVLGVIVAVGESNSF
jgi:pyruvate dehydrogenase E2 component (dihydrolipoyllysine-residue acetyltransferase)